MRFVLACLLLCACSTAPTLLDAPVDAGATLPDGGCDPNAWATACPTGQVCTADGTCNGPPCGNGNVVCDPSTVCSAQSDCVPPCRDASGAVITLDPLAPGQTCTSAGYLDPADSTAQCLLPCWYVLCTSARRGYGGGC